MFVLVPSDNDEPGEHAVNTKCPGVGVEHKVVMVLLLDDGLFPGIHAVLT